MISPGPKQQSIRPTGIFLKCRVVNARNVGLGLQLDPCDGKPHGKEIVASGVTQGGVNPTVALQSFDAEF
ncbi:MAG TPA: hypothetical protein VGK77_24725 [Candidatus Binatia bacterium]